MTSSGPIVLLATCSALPDGEPGGGLLLDAFSARGIEARWVAWDDPDIDWAEGVVAVRSTWDYWDRHEEFLAWTRSLPHVLNGIDAFAWNTDKRYLLELGERVLVVPTAAAYQPSGVAAAARQWGVAVAKPVVGAGGRGVVHGTAEELADADLGGGPWIVQPLVESVHDEGETSVFLFGGDVAGQVRKLPGSGEIRVHDQYGGHSEQVRVDKHAAALARDAVTAAEDVLGHRLDYARVDLMRLADGRLAVSELEVTECGFYLDVVPANAGAFADVVSTRLRGR